VEQISRIGMDTSKHVFQLHGVSAAEAVVLRKKLRRKEMVAILREACTNGDGDRLPVLSAGLPALQGFVSDPQSQAATPRSPASYSGQF
jgi:hypothetical protein